MMNQTVTYAIPSGKYNKKDGIANVPFTAQQGTSTQMYILAQSTMLDLIASCCTFFFYDHFLTKILSQLHVSKVRIFTAYPV